MSRTPRSNLAIEHAHRSGGPAAHPLVPVAAVGDYLAEGAIAVNARRTITYANRIATGLLGLRAESLIGRDVLGVATTTVGEASARFERALTEVLERGAEQVLTVNDADGTSPFNVDYCRLLPIADGGALILLGETMSPSVSEQLSKARALATVLQSVNQSLEVERVILLLAQHAADLLGGAGARVLMLDGDALVNASAVGVAEPAVGSRQQIDESFAGLAVRTLHATRTEDLRSVPHCRDIEILVVGTSPAARAPAVAAPLQIGNRPIGAVLVTGRPERRFTDHDEHLLITLATHGAIALENARLYRAAARTARHASILAATARTLAYNDTGEALYAGLARVVTESLLADGFSIYAADVTLRQVELLHSYGLGAEDSSTASESFWHTPAGAVVRTATPEFDADGESVRDVEPAVRGPSPSPIAIRSVAMLPLIIEGHARGLLVLRFGRPHSFEERERTLLLDFSTYVAVAMRNASLVGDLERRAARLSAVASVQLAISQTELHDVYAEIHRAVVSSVSDASCFALLLADQTAPLFRPQLIVVDGIVTRSHALPPVPFGDGAATEAVRTGQPVVSDRPLRSWGALVLGAASAGVFASELAAPMVHGDRTLGVLIVQSRQHAVFTAEDVELLSIIARQAGAAISNARLFEAQRGEREMAEAAARIARVALASTGPAAAAAAILAVVGDVVPAAGLAVGLLDHDDEIVYVGATGSSQDTLDQRVPLAESIAADLLRSEGARVERAASEMPPRDHALARGGVVIALAAKNRRLGVLAAAAPPGNTLSASSVDALRRLAPSIALAIDVQLLDEGERRQHERERMLATALATMDQPVFVLSLDRRVLYANDAAVREYGYTLDELSSMSIDRLVASALPMRAGDDLTRTPANVVVAEHVHRRRDGSQFPATVALSFIRQDSGAAIGHVLSVRNLTNERHIAEQLRQSEKLAALGELVAGVAHELNNPLAGISAFAQLLLEEPLDDDQRESVRLIKREADRAVGVIRDLLLFSRKAGPRTVPIDFNALIQLTLRLRAYSLRSSGVEVETHLDPTLPELPGDDQKLQQVVLNLIVNAEYAMRRAAMKRLVIRTTHDADTAVVEVADTGAGMSDETLQRVFEPFFTTKPAGEGTGLGLSVSYGIIEAHGGTITVESAPGRGTTFRIVLPVAPVPTDPHTKTS